MTKSLKMKRQPAGKAGGKKTTTKRKAQTAAVKAKQPKRKTGFTKRPNGAADKSQTERGNSKQARVIAMLRNPDGITIDAMMRATAWQQHSVRGFLAGVVRKKQGFDLVSEVGESGRIYRIKDPEQATFGKAGQ